MRHFRRLEDLEDPQKVSVCKKMLDVGRGGKYINNLKIICIMEEMDSFYLQKLHKKGQNPPSQFGQCLKENVTFLLMPPLIAGTGMSDSIFVRSVKGAAAIGFFIWSD